MTTTLEYPMKVSFILQLFQSYLNMEEDNLQSKLDKERQITLVSLNSRQQSTLMKIRQTPPHSDIPWSDILDLLGAIAEDLGGAVREYDDRVFIFIPQEQTSKCGVLHRRKRQKNASPSTIKDLRDLLLEI